MTISYTTKHCRLCNIVPGNKQLWVQHALTHRIDWSTRQCPHCDKVPGTRTSWDNHYKVHRKIHVCPDCSAEFAIRKDLTRHRGSVHKDPAVCDAVCLRCGLSFGRRDSLVRHLRRVHRLPHSEAVALAPRYTATEGAVPQDESL
jgi:uncharacterized C2H2 Zn-finger protein